MEARKKTAREVERHTVARVEDVPEGEHRIFSVAGREIGIFNVRGEYFALRNRCPHLGGPLCEGEVLGLVYSSKPGDVRFDGSKRLITCPWHGWEFDVKTGQSYFNPRLKARRYTVETSAGEASQERQEAVPENPDDLEPGPYKAEVLQVKEEGEYLVVTMPKSTAGREKGAS